MIHRIRLDAQQHAAFLAEQRKDPITKEPLYAGAYIVVCANDKVAFLADNWPGQCPICQGTSTLPQVPVNNMPSRLGRVISRATNTQPSPTFTPNLAQPNRNITNTNNAAEPMGFLGTVFLVVLLGGGMGFLNANGALNFIWENLVVGNAVYWSVSIIVYILTKRPIAAFFSQILLMLIPDGTENIVFVLIVSSVLYLLIAKFTNKRSISVFTLAVPPLCAEFAFDFYASSVWGWSFSGETVISYLIGVGIAAVAAFIVGKVFKRY